MRCGAGLLPQLWGWQVQRLLPVQSATQQIWCHRYAEEAGAVRAPVPAGTPTPPLACGVAPAAKKETVRVCGPCFYQLSEREKQLEDAVGGGRLDSSV